MSYAVREVQAFREAVAHTRQVLGAGAEMAHDGAEGLYRQGLKQLGISHSGIRDLSSLKAMFLAARDRRRGPSGTVAIAMDSRAERGFADRFPGALDITVLG